MFVRTSDKVEPVWKSAMDLVQSSLTNHQRIMLTELLGMGHGNLYLH